MRLVEVTITNFRSFAGTTSIKVASGHVVIVGANNSGKSNMAQALQHVLGNSAPFQVNQRLERDDYFDPSKPIEIKAVLGAANADDKQRLMPLATSKEKRGSLAKKDDPEVTLALTLPPLEPAEDEASSPKLLINLWGFDIHQKTTELRRSLVHLVVVTADRRVDDDLNASRWTPYGQLMKAVIESSPKFAALKQQLTDVNQSIEEVFAAQKKDLVADAQIVSYVDDISFQLTKENNPVELLRNLEILVEENGRRVSIDRVGTGMQSAVIIGMMELVLKAKSSLVHILLVEEPDAFIHPHGVRRLAELIRRTTGSDGAQALITTHSPSLLATLAPAEILRIARPSTVSVVHSSPGTLQQPTFARFVNPDNAEMFFAQRVVLVEGPTERFLFPPLSRLSTNTAPDFDQKQISVIDIGGKTNLLNYLRILHEFEITTRAVLDNDFLGDTTCSKLVGYLRARGETVDDTDSTQLRKDLLACGIIVLSKGEIEDYIPEADVAKASGKTLSEVQATLKSSAKTSDAFKTVFGVGKPVYARQLADHYLTVGTAPQKLAEMLEHLAAK